MLLDGFDIGKLLDAKDLAMYLAGPLVTVLTGLGIPLYRRARGIAGAEGLLIGARVWFTPMLVVEAIRAGGDVRRAWPLRLLG